MHAALSIQIIPGRVREVDFLREAQSVLIFYFEIDFVQQLSQRSRERYLVSAIHPQPAVTVVPGRDRFIFNQKQQSELR